MKRKLIFVPVLVGIAVLFAASFTIAEDKEGPMTGTWTCQAHGGSQGDTPFTLILQQTGEKVEGSVDSPLGGTQISSGTFKDNTLEIHIDAGDTNYVLTAKFEKGALSGTWGNENDKGTWEGKKGAAGSQ
ncbi:MAG: hypothetical protein ABSF71_14480 [Terriglobia bacterium]|jgi:hypothetical protein